MPIYKVQYADAAGLLSLYWSFSVFSSSISKQYLFWISSAKGYRQIRLLQWYFHLLLSLYANCPADEKFSVTCSIWECPSSHLLSHPHKLPELAYSRRYLILITIDNLWSHNIRALLNTYKRPSTESVWTLSGDISMRIESIPYLHSVQHLARRY